jgi:penicillin amidase
VQSPPALRALRRTLLAILLTLLVLASAAYFALRASLPQLDGEVRSSGVRGPTRIERDALGVPTIRASTRLDVAWATGFVHGQDRFFQMDLSRRLAAGELSEIIGPLALDTDRRMRIHRFREVARRVLANASREDRAIAESYARGVNAARSSLAGRPFEYWLLRSAPTEWRVEDSILVVFAMYEQLNYDAFATESARGRVRDAVPAGLYRYIYARGGEWDAPLEGTAFTIAPPPSAAEFSLRTQTLPLDRLTTALRHREDRVYGSNNWAVAGARTRSGAALLANDMHLGLSIPNTWYRARLQVDGSAGDPAIDVTGVTLPGVPVVVVGSNGRVAWGFTNSQGDWVDLIVLQENPADPGTYATPDGPKALHKVREIIHVNGASDETLEVLETIWGPVFDRDHAGQRRAAAWIAHEPRATNFVLREMETARDVEHALAIAARCGVPPQNFVAADAQGNIGWTIMGRIPVRQGYDSRAPADWSRAGTGWQGWLEAGRYPRIVNPPQGKIWTANARVVDGEALALLGESDLYLGARARQIRDDLLPLEAATEGEMLAIQLDDRARFLERWHARLQALLDEAAVRDSPKRAEFRRLLEPWNGHASVESVAYRLVRAWRRTMHDLVFAALTYAAREPNEPPDAIEVPSQFEGPLWQLLSTEPEHLLPANFKSWRELELHAVDVAIESLGKECKTLAACTWGDRNRVRIRHALGGLPLIGAYLNMPQTELPGDSHMPRVQAVSFGASQRLAVSPGHEAQGYFHMPGGQSGHPLSRFYRAGHEAWAKGRPLPFLPGPPEHQLLLTPGTPE